MPNVFTRPPRSAPPRRSSAARRRGIAMLLVLGMLAAVTILSAGALTSQQQAPTTGHNAVAEVQARWSAESAAEIAAAVLETTYDYSGANAEMMVDQLVAQGLASVSVTNLQGQPPQPGDRELLLTATAEVNGVTREITKRISVTPTLAPTAAADPYLNEFGIVATDGLVLDPGSEVRTWAASPDAHSTKPVAIGAFTGAGAKVIIDPGACVRGTALFAGPNADPDVVSLTKAGGMTALGAHLPYSIPLAPEITPAAFGSLSVGSVIDIDACVPLHSGTLPVAGRCQSLTIKNGTEVTLDAAVGTHYSFHHLQISDSGVLKIKGAVVIQVRDDLKVTDLGAIVLDGAGSAAAFFTHGDVEIDNAGVGVPVDVARNASRSLALLDETLRPSRLRFFGQDTGFAAVFRLQNNALAVAVVHTPTNEVILEQSALVGRAAALAVALSTGSSLHYDPRLDNRMGFTNVAGPLYAENAAPLASVTAALAGFSPTEGAQVLKSRFSGITATPTPSLSTEPGPGPTPTNRTNRVVIQTKVERDDDTDNDLIPDEDEEDDL